MEHWLSISVTDVGGAIIIENLSDIGCIVSVKSPEGEQRFEVASGESVIVTGTTQPIEVRAVGR